jgi:hypothetical protein
MTEVKEQFIQVGIKDLCHSSSIAVTLETVSSNVTYNKNVKQSYHRPGQALSFPEG